MLYYKDLENKIHCVESNDFAYLLPNGCEEITESEAEDIRNSQISLNDLIIIMYKKIDSDADSIYASALGNRATEYAQAETEANEYKDAGYIGVVPDYVQAWADATGNSATWAADNILATATAWRAAQFAIRANRLAFKETAKLAEEIADLDTVKSGWNAFVVTIREQLGIV